MMKKKKSIYTYAIRTTHAMEVSNLIDHKLSSHTDQYCYDYVCQNTTCEIVLILTCVDVDLRTISNVIELKGEVKLLTTINA